MAEEPDRVDRIIEQWRHERPDLDPTAKAVTGRAVRIGHLIQARIGAALAPLGIRDGDYGLLSALRRAGEPYEQSPTELRRHLVITSGGLTLQLERLERAGLVRRRPNPDDGRGVLVALTSEGTQLVDDAMGRHAALEHHLVAALTRREQDQLAGLLRKLLRALDSEEP